MKKTSLYLTLAIVMTIALTIGDKAVATTDSASSGYNTPVIRSALNFTAVLNATTGDVDMTWTPYAPSGFNYYKIVRSTTKSNPFYPEDGYIKYYTDPDANSSTDTDVPSGTSYYRVCSIAKPYRYCSPVVAIVNTDSSESMNNNGNPEEGAITVTASEENGKVRLTWTAEGDFSYGFKIAKSTMHANPTYPVMAGDSYYYLSNGIVRSYVDGDVETGHTYHYRICRYNSGGACSFYSNPVMITLSGTPQGESENPLSLTLSAQETEGKVVLSWTASGSVLNGFKVLKSMMHEYPTYPVMSGDKYVYLTDSNARSYEDDDVAPGKTYHYRVCQYSGNGSCLSYSNKITITLSGSSEDGSSLPLHDISENVYAGAIGYVYHKGIVKGYGDGTYRPRNPISRAEFIKVVVEAKYDDEVIETCLETAGENSLFLDVPETAWFAKYVCVAKMKGIITGYPDGTFKPGQHVNIAEAAKMLVNVFGIEAPNRGKAWYVRYIFALQARRFIPWTVTGLHVYLTRSEMAEMIWRIMENEMTQDSRDDLVEE